MKLSHEQFKKCFLWFSFLCLFSFSFILWWQGTNGQTAPAEEATETAETEDIYKTIYLETLYEAADQAEFEHKGDIQEDTGSEELSENAKHEYSAEDWRLTLVNKQHSIPEDYEIELLPIGDGMFCDKRIYEDLKAMEKAARKDNIIFVYSSGYRDRGIQEFLFKRHLNRNLNSGLSYIDAYKVSCNSVILPGCSEHQLGLALDIVCPTYTNLVEGFAETDCAKWLLENCYKYGFILRYPKGKEEITEIIYEPWHFRYVGKEAAELIMSEGITLEEFWEEYITCTKY